MSKITAIALVVILGALVAAKPAAAGPDPYTDSSSVNLLMRVDSSGNLPTVGVAPGSTSTNYPHDPARAIDGGNQPWRITGHQSTETLRLTLPETVEMTQFDIYWRSPFYATDYTLKGSTDGFGLMNNLIAPVAGNANATRLHSFNSTEVQYLELSATGFADATYYITYEVEAYGTGTVYQKQGYNMLFEPGKVGAITADMSRRISGSILNTVDQDKGTYITGQNAGSGNSWFVVPLSQTTELMAMTIGMWEDQPFNDMKVYLSADSTYSYLEDGGLDTWPDMTWTQVYDHSLGNFNGTHFAFTPQDARFVRLEWPATSGSALSEVALYETYWVPEPASLLLLGLGALGLMRRRTRRTAEKGGRRTGYHSIHTLALTGLALAAIWGTDAHAAAVRYYENGNEINLAAMRGNVATARNYTHSNMYGMLYPAYLIEARIGGNATNPPSSYPWWQVDFGAEFAVENFIVHTYPDPYAINTVSIQTSNDGVNFSERGTASSSSIGYINGAFNDGATSARYVRVVATSWDNDGYPGIFRAVHLTGPNADMPVNNRVSVAQSLWNGGTVTAPNWSNPALAIDDARYTPENWGGANWPGMYTNPASAEPITITLNDEYFMEAFAISTISDTRAPRELIVSISPNESGEDFVPVMIMNGTSASQIGDIITLTQTGNVHAAHHDITLADTYIARRVRFEILSNQGHASQVYLAELHVYGTAVPEPTSLLLLVLGGLALMRRRSRKA